MFYHTKFWREGWVGQIKYILKLNFGFCEIITFKVCGCFFVFFFVLLHPWYMEFPQARYQTCAATETTGILACCTTVGTPSFKFQNMFFLEKYLLIKKRSNKVNQKKNFKFLGIYSSLNCSEGFYFDKDKLFVIVTFFFLFYLSLLTFKIDEELVTNSGKFLILDRMLPELKIRGHKVLLSRFLVH